jgi:pyruvate/2-oxoglutarate dehydrogenase complex dihydrolipoamide acyltransferase (E2) component
MTPSNGEGATLRLPWLSMSTVIVLAAALLVLFRPHLRKRFEASGASQPAAVPALRATPQGDSLRIAWPAGERAAVLSIQDGGAWHRIELNRQVLAAGQFLYQPASTEVLVRLDVTDGPHRGVTETVRLLGLPAHREAPPAPAPVEEAALPLPDEQSADRAVTAPPEMADRKTPSPLPKALATVHGIIRVDVRVTIAADGTVQSAELMAPAQSRYFNRLSLAAAQESRFLPSTDGGSLVLRYEYTREGVQVSQPEP